MQAAGAGSFSALSQRERVERHSVRALFSHSASTAWENRTRGTKTRNSFSSSVCGMFSLFRFRLRRRGQGDGKGHETGSSERCLVGFSESCRCSLPFCHSSLQSAEAKRQRRGSHEGGVGAQWRQTLCSLQASQTLGKVLCGPQLVVTLFLSSSVPVV